MHRFFVPSQSLKSGVAELHGGSTRQMAEVLRLRPGDYVILLDNSGWEYDTEIEVLSSELMIGRVKSKRLGATEPRVKITLYQGLIRASNFEWVLQKCTEVGVSSFVPLICERSSVGHLGEIGQQKWDRWQRIIAEAAEQSKRAKLPVLQPATLFPQVCERLRGASLLAYEGELYRSLREVLCTLGSGAKGGSARWPTRVFSLNLLIGPEGGFSDREIEMARSYGAHLFGMGPRTLRSETAAIVAASLTLHELGDLQP